MEAGEERLQRCDPDLWQALKGGPQYSCIDMSVSFDITWQKPGFTYLIGVGVGIDVLTGLVIDYDVLTKYCHACNVNTKRIPHVELLVWKAAHARDCWAVASSTTSPPKPRSKGLGKLRGAAPSSDTACGMLRCSATVILLCTRQSVSSSHTGKMWKYISLNVYTIL